MTAQIFPAIPERTIEQNWAAMTPKDQRAFFAENGFLVIPKAFSAKEIGTMHADIKLYDLEEQEKPSDATKDFRTAPSFAAMIDNPKILSAVKNILGHDIRCFKGDYVAKKSKPVGTPPQHLPLHVDYGIGKDQRNYCNTSPLWINAACYLTNMTVEHAPFVVVPGSNHKYNLTPGTDMEHLKEDAIALFAHAGDTILFLHTTVHAGGVNVSGTTQHILFCSYRPAWAHPIGRVEEWPRSFVASSPPERQYLLTNLNIKRRSYKNRLRLFLGRLNSWMHPPK